MSTNGKRTPGPWRAVQNRHTQAFTAIGNGDYGAVASTEYCRPSPDENEANARLIAAAPELLAENEKSLTALRAAYLAVKGNLSNGDRYEAMALIEEAIKGHGAAIAKAKGEA